MRFKEKTHDMHPKEHTLEKLSQEVARSQSRHLASAAEKRLKWIFDSTLILAGESHSENKHFEPK